jgi:hypothetical protein
MAVIIGAGTVVSIPSLFTSGGFVSINFGVDPQMNRLWQIGSYSPYDIYTSKQRSFSLTAYGKRENGTGGSQLYDVSASTSCSNPSNPVTISVTPTSCGYTIAPFSYVYWPTSYNYSKDNFGWGQESWSFTTEPEMSVPYAGTVLFIRGIATGQVQTGDGIMTAANQGVVYDDAASRDSNGNFIDGESGSVSAGFPGIGEYSVQREYIVTHVGNSEGKADGYQGAASVTIPMTPVYI